MASQNRTSVVSDIVKVTFRAKTSKSDTHWKEIGAVLQRANEKRLSVVYQEPSVVHNPNPSSRAPKIWQNHPIRQKMAYALFCALVLTGDRPYCTAKPRYTLLQAVT